MAMRLAIRKWQNAIQNLEKIATCKNGCKNLTTLGYMPNKTIIRGGKETGNFIITSGSNARMMVL